MREKTKIIVEVGAAVGALWTFIVLMRFESLRFAGWEAPVFMGIPLVGAILLNLPAHELGVSLRNPLGEMRLFGLACAIFLPPFVAGFFAYQLLARGEHLVFHFPRRLAQEAAANFLYLALPEEFLFRGYLQQRLGRVLPGTWKFLRFEVPVAGVACAALFALAHVTYDAGWQRGLVFFPALVFAWLRRRSGTIVAPTLFHGTCNVVAYCAGEMFA
jgi:membrane protease YdiL (CAAX protease family)